MSLSWFLYLAGVLPALGGWFVTFAIVSGVAALGLIFTRILNIADGKDGDLIFFNKYFKHLTIITVGFALMSCLIPSQKTIISIAVVETAQTVIQSDYAKEVGGEMGDTLNMGMKLLRQKINEQLETTK